GGFGGEFLKSDFHSLLLNNKAAAKGFSGRAAALPIASLSATQLVHSRERRDRPLSRPFLCILSSPFQRRCRCPSHSPFGLRQLCRHPKRMLLLRSLRWSGQSA